MSETRCVACGEVIVKEFLNHKCSREALKRIRERERNQERRRRKAVSDQSYCRRLRDGFRMIGGE